MTGRKANAAQKGQEEMQRQDRKKGKCSTERTGRKAGQEGQEERQRQDRKDRKKGKDRIKRTGRKAEA